MNDDRPAYESPAHVLAGFDQAYAEASEQLDGMINAHREHLAAGTEPRDVAISGMAAWLSAMSDKASLVPHLAVAIHRLAADTARLEWKSVPWAEADHRNHPDVRHRCQCSCYAVTERNCPEHGEGALAAENTDAS